MSTSAALFTPAQSKVLALIFGRPDRAFHISELIRLTGLGSASLQREIKRLALAGLVVEKRIGNVRQLQANPESPVFSEVTSLVQKTLGVASVLRSALEPLSDRIALAVLFGSVAKQQEHANSDTDVLLVSDSLGFTDLMTALLPAQETLLRRINPTVLTGKEFAARRAQPDSFVNRVLAGAHEVILGTAT
jgi:predicted nucleotidyltransferase